MATQTRPEGKARTYGENIESDLASRFLRVVEVAAIASARTMGQGERKLSDEVATEAMRKTMDSIPMHGTIVIGEGERDEAPMLYIGEKVGAEFPDGTEVPEVDIAVDPLEGTNLCATGAPGSITVLAASERGGLLNAPDCYMDKIVVGPSCKDAVYIDAPVSHNLKNIARRLDRDVEDLVVMVLDRPRHEKLIADIRAAGARIRLIGDGDLSAGIAAAVIGTGVHAVMGSGGAPEGVITAAAVRCLNGYMLGRLVVKPEQEERLEPMGIKDKNRIYGHRRRANEGRSLLRRRYTHFFRHHDPAHRESALRGKHPLGKESGLQGEILVSVRHSHKAFGSTEDGQASSLGEDSRKTTSHCWCVVIPQELSEGVLNGQILKSLSVLQVLAVEDLAMSFQGARDNDRVIP